MTRMVKDSAGKVIKQNSKFIAFCVIFFIVLIFLIFAVIFSVKIINNKMHSGYTLVACEDNWKKSDYENCYAISLRILQSSPLNDAALIYHGYSSFYLAISQIDTSLTQNYLDEAINCIRIAITISRQNILPQLYYMLGKSYFYKNSVTSYYYSDLALKYFKLALEKGYKSNDIAEYMGLSYASLGNHKESILSFTEALVNRESPSLLLSIAEQYYKVGQSIAAKQYLYRIKNESNDDELILKSMNLLGSIYIDEGNLDDAKTEFESILEKNKNSADAYYGLGVIYEKQGDMVKARSQWRNALKVQVNHIPASEKLTK